MIYDELITAIGPEGGLDGLADGAAGLDVANNSAVFSIVTIFITESLFSNSSANDTFSYSKLDELNCISSTLILNYAFRRCMHFNLFLENDATYF